jgi:hypothetical protein
MKQEQGPGVTPEDRPKDDDRGAPDGQRPSYLDRCEGMTAGELRGFIRGSLEKLSACGAGAERPNSEEEFRALWRMLREKVRGSAEQRRNRGRRDDPAARLGLLSAKLDRLIDRQREAWGAPSTKKRDIHQMQRRREELEGEISRLEEEISRSRYNRSYGCPQTTADPLSQILTEVRKDIDRAFRPSEHFVHWRLLPPGELSAESIRRYYSGLQAEHPGARYDLERIEKALSLRPHQRYEEIDGIEGYIVFRFPHTPAALMECPKVGNAIYVIHKDWERWSRMSKQDLMSDDSGEVTKIVHQGDWFGRVKEALKADVSPRNEPSPTP